MHVMTAVWFDFVSVAFFPSQCLSLQRYQMTHNFWMSLCTGLQPHYCYYQKHHHCCKTFRKINIIINTIFSNYNNNMLMLVFVKQTWCGTREQCLYVLWRKCSSFSCCTVEQQTRHWPPPHCKIQTSKPATNWAYAPSSSRYVIPHIKDRWGESVGLNDARLNKVTDKGRTNETMISWKSKYPVVTELVLLVRYGGEMSWHGRINAKH